MTQAAIKSDHTFKFGFIPTKRLVTLLRSIKRENGHCRLPCLGFSCSEGSANTRKPCLLFAFCHCRRRRKSGKHYGSFPAVSSNLRQTVTALSWFNSHLKHKSWLCVCDCGQCVCMSCELRSHQFLTTGCYIHLSTLEHSVSCASVVSVKCVIVILIPSCWSLVSLAH